MKQIVSVMTVLAIMASFLPVLPITAPVVLAEETATTTSETSENTSSSTPETSTTSPECVCTLEYAPVCGVDGRTYSNKCNAECAGVEIDSNSSCAVIDSTDTIHFVMEVKWGNVLGDVQDKNETNFTGSVAVSSNAKVSLIKSLLFESHTSQADLITSNMDPVSWNSLVYGHWDGARVMVSSPASDTVTITAGSNTVSKTAKEFYEAKNPIVQSVGNGKEIWIKTHPAPKHSYVMKLVWGKVDRESYSSNGGVNSPRGVCHVGSAATSSKCVSSDLMPISTTTSESFNGYLSLTDSSAMKLVRTVRFEENDKILEGLASKIAWNSVINGDIDGIFVKFNLADKINKNTKFTLAFTDQSYIVDISLMDLYHKGIIKKEIKDGYGFYASVWKFSSRKLVRARNSYKVYMIEDGMKRHIPNPRVFDDQGLNWEDVEVVDSEEVETLPEGDVLAYTEGTLIKGNSPEVYAISNGEKRHVANPSVFGKLKYDWKNIIKVDDTELALYSTGSAIGENSEYPDQSLLRFEGEPTVYAVQGDTLKPVTSPESFASNNYRWNRVLVVAKNIKNKYKVGNNLELGDGALVKDSSGKVYAIDQGKKRWVRSAKDLEKAGFKWGDIINVSNKEISAIAEGEDVMADDVK